VSGIAPLFARLYRYRLSHAQRAVLQAMAEHSSDGQEMFASIERIAAYTGLSARRVQQVLHGQPAVRFAPADPPLRVEARPARRAVPGLIELGVLALLKPANTESRRPATYRIDESKLQVDPRTASYTSRQRVFERASAEKELERWIEHNRSAFDALIQRMALAREAAVGSHHSEAEWLMHDLVLAKKYGLSERLARCAFGPKPKPDPRVPVPPSRVPAEQLQFDSQEEKPCAQAVENSSYLV